MLGINGGEMLLLLVVAVLVVGPARLPHYAQQLAVLVRRAMEMAKRAKAAVDDELGADATGIDWQALDPRQYDPRRIVRDALSDVAKSPLSSGNATPDPTSETRGPIS